MKFLLILSLIWLVAEAKSGKFHCKNEETIPKTLVCNGKANCADSSDEINCPFTGTPKTGMTSSNCGYMFTCADGRCINPNWVNDCDNDCGDNSDETDQYTCANSGKCIRQAYICDHDDDCGDNSDEQNCTIYDAETCPGMLCDGNATCVIGQGHICDGHVECRDGSDETDCQRACVGFQCHNTTRCVSNSWLCDGDNDCGDMSDEQNCSDVVCPEHKCPNSGRCIRSSSICDGDNDCGDMSDEQNCTEEACDTFVCSSTGRCLFSTSWLCDGDNDCGDMSDEQNCSVSPESCDTFRCMSTGRCLPAASWVCDGDNDCGDMSDEQNCRPTTARPCQGFQCPNSSLCIYSSWICDGDNDCGDFSDEQDCQNRSTTNAMTHPIMTTTRYPVIGVFCADNMFRCPDGRCLPDQWKCDGDNDCGDNFDENGCQNETAPDVRQCSSRSSFPCANGLCIPGSWQCDNVDDCRDNSDEINCSATTPVQIQCSSGHFRCSDGTCIPTSWQCDGANDCGDNSDEPDTCKPSSTTTANPFGCPGGWFRCISSGFCIKRGWVCDGENDCGDMSDEENCLEIVKCPEFRCDNGRCQPDAYVCDRDNDCGDMSDERNCEYTCRSDQYQCSNGRCINAAYQCDADNDCGDGSDEAICENCTSNAFKCESRQKCVSRYHICDNSDDCGDGSDERDCVVTSTTPPACSGFQCENGRCVPSSFICDGDNDCLDMSDEQNCSDLNCPGKFKCDKGNCINPSWVCDRDNDCGDGSDERDCDFRTTTRTPCRGFECSNGDCLVQQYVCDGQSDCSDGSDEANCSQENAANDTEPIDFGKCGYSSAMGQIYGGGVAMVGQFPWMVKLDIAYPGTSGGCGAVLIDSSWVLTAAHCVVSYSMFGSREEAISVRMKMGLVDLESDAGVTTTSYRMIPHPNYRGPQGEYDKDVALIKLNSPVTFSKTIRPICLPEPLCNDTAAYASPIIDGCSELEVAGWGKTDVENSPRYMRAAQVSIKPRTRCNQEQSVSLTYAQLCLGDGDPTVCKGDSGGPAMCINRNRYYVLGLVSYGSPCGEGDSEVFSRLCGVMTWIKETMNSN